MKVEKVCRGCLIIDNDNIRPYMMSFGYGGSPSLQQFRGSLILERNSRLILKGTTTFSEGTSVRVEEGASLAIGENFYCNKNCYLRSGENITIGDNCLFGWNITINDSDGHSLLKNGIKQKDKSPIVLGNHIWLTPFVKVTKGARIPDNCVVAQSAIVTEKNFEENSLIGGIPAKSICNNINWQR